MEFMKWEGKNWMMDLGLFLLVVMLYEWVDYN